MINIALVFNSLSASYPWLFFLIRLAIKNCFYRNFFYIQERKKEIIGKLAKKFVLLCNWQSFMNKIKFRCLDRSLQVPPYNPVFCYRKNPLNTTYVMECCKNEDFCNVHLSPQLMPKPRGKKKCRTIPLKILFYYFFTSTFISFPQHYLAYPVFFFS